MNDSIKNTLKAYPDNSDFSDFFEAYIVTALWSSVSDDDDGITDEHDGDDIDPETLRYLAAVAYKFHREKSCFIDAEPEPPTCRDGSGPHAMAGHDFWLTSAGHGAGFWDGDWPRYGDMFTKASEASGTIELYVGDNGKIYA